MHTIKLTTDSHHIFRECSCGRVHEDVTGQDVRLTIYQHRLHQDEAREATRSLRPVE